LVWFGSIILLVVSIPGFYRLASWWSRVQPVSGRAVLLFPIAVGAGVAAFVLGWGILLLVAYYGPF
jgi:hypothetical protein